MAAPVTLQTAARGSALQGLWFVRDPGWAALNRPGDTFRGRKQLIVAGCWTGEELGEDGVSGAASPLRVNVPPPAVCT